MAPSCFHSCQPPRSGYFPLTLRFLAMAVYPHILQSPLEKAAGRQGYNLGVCLIGFLLVEFWHL